MIQVYFSVDIRNVYSKHTKLLSSTGTPATLVDSRSLLLLGDSENLIVSPKLTTWFIYVTIRSDTDTALQTRMNHNNINKNEENVTIT